MDNRFEESFNELGLIYETYFIAKKAGGQRDSVDSEIGYRKGTFSTPQGSINQYKKGEVPTVIAVIDEEQPEDPIIVKIEEMEKEAEDHGQDYALLQLATLKKFIEES